MSRKCLALLSGHSSPGPIGLQPDYTRARPGSADVKRARYDRARFSTSAEKIHMTLCKVLATALIAMAGSTAAAFADSLGQNLHEAEKRHQEMHREYHKAEMEARREHRKDHAEMQREAHKHAQERYREWHKHAEEHWREDH